MKKELVVSKQTAAAIASYTGNLISDISFDELSDIIDKIANNKEELTDGMRAAATTYAEKWDALVVERLDVKYERLKTLQEFFSKNSVSYYDIECLCCSTVYHHRYEYQDDPVAMTVVNMLRSGDNKKWHSFADKLEAITDKIEKLREQSSEEKPRYDDYVSDERTMSYDDKVVAVKQHELAVAQFERELYKKQIVIRVEFLEFYKELMKDPDIKEMIKVLKTQLKKIGGAKAAVHEKSALVKLAVNFGGTDLLKALQELHEFQKAI